MSCSTATSPGRVQGRNLRRQNCVVPHRCSMEVVMGPATWGESVRAEPDSPSSVLEALALHPSGNSKVRRMSKEFERLLQYRASAGEQPLLKEQPCCENPVAQPGASAFDAPPASDEAYPVGLEQAGTFVGLLRERRQSLRSLEDRRASESSTVSDTALRAPILRDLLATEPFSFRCRALGDGAATARTASKPQAHRGGGGGR